MAFEMTIGKRFTTTSGILLLFMALMAAVAIFGFNGIGTGVHSLATDTIPGMQFAFTMEVDAANMRGDQLRHLLATDPEEQQKWAQSAAEKRALFGEAMKSYGSGTPRRIPRPPPPPSRQLTGRACSPC
jgi:hypothetical protein